MNRISAFFRNITGKNGIEHDLTNEVQAYIEMATAEKIAAGLSPAEARRRALVEFGGAEQVKEEVRAVRAGALFEQLAQDLRFGLRMLRKNPGFTAVAVLTIALGIGANSSIFSVFDTVALRPLQFANADRLVDVYQTIRGKVSRNVHGGANLISFPEFQQYRDQSEVFTAAAAYMPEFRATLASTHDELTGQLVTCNFFLVLEIKPAFGRSLLPSDCASAGASPVVLLSNDLWRNSFNSDPAIVGKVIRLNRVPLTVIGVMQPDFHGSSIIPAAFWAPISMVSSLVKVGNINADYLTAENLSWLASRAVAFTIANIGIRRGSPPHRRHL